MIDCYVNLEIGKIVIEGESRSAEDMEFSIKEIKRMVSKLKRANVSKLSRAIMFEEYSELNPRDFGKQEVQASFEINKIEALDWLLDPENDSCTPYLKIQFNYEKFVSYTRTEKINRRREAQNELQQIIRKLFEI